MDINWSRYIEIARAQDLGSAEVARLIRTETRRKVNISEVKRRLSVSESAAAQIRQPNSLDVINLCEGEADEESTLSISAKGMTFEFKTQRPEECHLHSVSHERRRHMNIRFSGVHVTLVISPTDLRGGFHRLCSLAQDQLGINLSSGKEAVVFLSKTRKICKIVTTDEKGTMLLTRTLHNGRFEELMVRVGQQAKCSLTLSDLERFLNGERLYTKSDTFW